MGHHLVRKILVICHENRLRSVVCFAAMRARIDKWPADVRPHLFSAGFVRPNRRAASSTRVYCAERLGVDVDDHVSRLVTSEMIEQADIIVYMDEHNKRMLAECCKSAGLDDSMLKKAVCLAHCCEPQQISIRDPVLIATKSHEFRTIMDEIVSASERFLSRLWAL